MAKRRTGTGRSQCPVCNGEPVTARTASYRLLWTRLAAFNAVVLLTLWLTSRSLRRREHGI